MTMTNCPTIQSLRKAPQPLIDRGQKAPSNFLREHTHPVRSNLVFQDIANYMNFIATERQVKGRPFALVSGGGPTGLTTALTLQSLGFNTLVIEKRTEYSRTNNVELKKEALFTLKKLDPSGCLLSDLIQRGMSLQTIKISIENEQVNKKSHRGKLLYNNNSSHTLPSSIASKEASYFEALDLATPYEQGLKDLDNPSLSMSSKEYSNEDFASVIVSTLESSLNEFAIRQGIKILNASYSLGHSHGDHFLGKIENSKGNLTYEFNLNEIADLICLAEGASSLNSQYIGDQIKAPTEEKWHQENYILTGISANKLPCGSSFIYNRQDKHKNPEMSNIIFYKDASGIIINSSSISSSHARSKTIIKKHTLKSLEAIHSGFGPHAKLTTVSSTYKNPIEVSLKRSTVFAKNNVILVGDTACSGSPVGGYGASLGLSAWQGLVEKHAQSILKLKDSKSHIDSVRSYNKSSREIIKIRWGRPFRFMIDTGYYSDISLIKEVIKI